MTEPIRIKVSATKIPKGAKKLRKIPKKRTYYATQFFRTEKNKVRRLKRHVRHFPNDAQAAAALALL